MMSSNKNLYGSFYGAMDQVRGHYDDDCESHSLIMDAKCNEGVVARAERD